MDSRREHSGATTGLRWWRMLSVVVCLVLAGFLVGAGIDVEELPDAGVPAVEENMDAAQVNQPVTAVLLNFRAYDTWLEVGVLLAAVFGLLTLHRSHGLASPPDVEADPVLDAITRLLVPSMVLFAGFLLWAGTRIPGGAFQAGAILAGAGVLLRVAGVGSGIDLLMTGRALRLTAAFAFTLFLVAGAATVISGRHLLEYPAGWGGGLIFILEAGVMISVGWTLAFAYLAAAPPRSDTKRGGGG